MVEGEYEVVFGTKGPRQRRPRLAPPDRPARSHEEFMDEVRSGRYEAFQEVMVRPVLQDYYLNLGREGNMAWHVFGNPDLKSAVAQR